MGDGGVYDIMFKFIIKLFFDRNISNFFVMYLQHGM
jgi:hypothetical protein